MSDDLVEWRAFVRGYREGIASRSALLWLHRVLAFGLGVIAILGWVR